MRRFGIELEVISKKSATQIAEILRDNGIECYPEHYNHLTRSHWKIVGDASIRTTQSHTKGFEVVSPVLEGGDGLIEACTVVEILQAQECDANVSCGFHVHVDGSDLTSKEIANIVRSWIRNEWIVDTLVPNSRRANNNLYCKSIHRRLDREYTRDYEKRIFDRVEEAENRSIEAIIDYCNPSNNRYFKLNLTAYRRHRTIEFRYHSGTANPEKVIRQIQFCIAFVEKYSAKRLMTVFGHAAHSATYRKPLAKATIQLLSELATELPELQRKEFKTYWKRRQRTLAA